MTLPDDGSAPSNSGGYKAIREDAIGLASKDYVVDAIDGGGYDKVTVHFPNVAAIPGSNMPNSRTYGRFADMNGNFGVGLVTHEMGHANNLAHAGLWKVSDRNPISQN